MAKQKGWVSIHRKIQEHWIWKDEKKLKWWLDILLTANSTPARVNIGNEIFDCERGESLISLKGWAERLNTSKDSARNFLKLLEKDGMITSVSVGKSTRITICNYESYQDGLHVNQTHSKRIPNANQTQTHPNNKENKENKENNIEGAHASKTFVPPSLAEVINFFVEKGYTPSSAERAHEYYEAANWRDSKGKQVISWKQEMIAVWFKEENKLPPARVVPIGPEPELPTRKIKSMWE